MENVTVPSFTAEIEQWRQQREAELRAPDGWLSLAGLFLLADGCHRAGSAPDNDIVLPPSAPAHLGEIWFHNGRARLEVTRAQPVLVDGKPASSAALADNGGGQPPTLVTTGSVTFFVHHFGNQYAIRVKDSANAAIGAFAGRRWYSVAPHYRVTGRYTPFDAVQSIPIATVVQTASHYRSSGVIDFTLEGRDLRLLAAPGAGAGQLFIVFRDATAGEETYAAARFLHAAVDAAGDVDLDFNRAVSPPCAFTPYATCPLPPPANILPLRIEAGERL